jgi:uncharacterized protein (TIGR00369 family)
MCKGEVTSWVRDEESIRDQPLSRPLYTQVSVQETDANLGHLTMTGRNNELVNQIFENARFIRSLGIQLTSSGDGWCETRIQLTPTLLQQHGLVHAGVLMTLADHTCGGAAATMAPEGQDVITVENKVSFLRPASGQELFCRADVLRAGKRLIFVEAKVTTKQGEDRAIVAKASSTLAFIPLKLPAQVPL